MTRRMHNRNPGDVVDPLGPVGPGDEAPPADELAADLPVEPDEPRLLELVERATRPPAGLTLDWKRFGAALDAEPVRRAGRRPVVLRRIYYLGGALAGAAAVLLATLVVPHQPPAPPGPGQPIAGPVDPDGPSVVRLAAAEPVVRIGVDAETARGIIDRDDPDADAPVRVVFPRRDPPRPEPVQLARAGPIILTDRAPMLGTAYAYQTRQGDSETDLAFLGF